MLKLKNYKDLSDIELFIKIEKYDPYAIEEVYLRYSPVLFPLITRIINDHQAAEKLLIGVFISLWRKIDLFNFNSGNTYTWLITLARNKAVSFVRKKHSENHEQKIDEDEDFYIMPDLDEKIKSLDLNSALRSKAVVEDAFDRLTEAQKYVLFLSYYDGFTLNSIAEKLNIPLTTIRSKITMSLQNLRDNLLNSSTKNAENTELNEMMAAYAVGCMDNENYSYFKKHKQIGGYLPEGSLGELQSTISYLPMILKNVSVSKELKNTLGYKLLQTQKDMNNNLIPDRRIVKVVENIEEKVDNIQPVQIPIPDEVVVEKHELGAESEKIEEPDNSRSKLFWFFNFLLLAALILFSYLLSDKTSQLNDRVELMKQQLVNIKSETSAAKDFIAKNMEFIRFFKNPNINIIQLIGVKENPNSFGRLFLSLDAGEGLLELNSMPNLESEKFYSLWMAGKDSALLLCTFKINPEQKYIKVSQIPYIPINRETIFRITKESVSGVNKPSGKTYLFGTFSEPRHK